MIDSRFQFDAHVGSHGKVEVAVPCAEGTAVKVFVVPVATDDFSDLMAAAAASADFWDNPWDDEAWNNA
jgi:hypothetical protein